VASDKKFYEQLNSKIIGELDALTIQTLSNPVHLESGNKSILDAINLVNNASFRSDGGPLPATSVIATATATESGTRVVIKQPQLGEIWRVIAMTIESVAGGSGDVVYDIFVGDGTELQNITKRTQTSPPVHINQELEYPAGLTIDSNNSLQFSATRSSLSSAKIQVLMTRIR